MYSVFLVPKMEEQRSLNPLLKQDLPLCPYRDYYLDAIEQDLVYLFHNLYLLIPNS